MSSPCKNQRTKQKIENLKRKIENRCFTSNIIETKSFDFAVRIVKLYKLLCEQRKEYILSKQLIRSATSIGANISEAQQAQSKADFISKLSISLKETSETKYWIKLLLATDYLSTKEADSLLNDCTEIEKLLVAILKTSKSNS